MSQDKHDREPLEIERIQTGVRLEKRMLKVLKAIAEQKDMTLGDLIRTLGGKLVRGSPEVMLIGVDDLSSASAMDLVFAEDEDPATKALASGATAVVLRPGMAATSAASAPTARPGTWSRSGSATRSTSRSIAMASCSRTTPTWSGT